MNAPRDAVRGGEAGSRRSVRDGASVLPMQAEGLSLALGGRSVLDRIELRIEAGERIAVIGPNGAGKSQLLRACAGLVAPTAGRVAWARPDVRSRVALVFQRPVLLRRSVHGNLELALAFAGVPRSERAARIADALARVGLLELAGQPARRLSGGQQQRVAIARAAALAPELLWLDEPTAHLDPAAARAVESAVLSMADDGATVVWATHDAAQARRIARRVVLVVEGRIAEDAPADAFFAGPSTTAGQRWLAGELLA